MYKYLFGPVLSRRLGISLGLDLIPYKTCSYDCVYCECRKTTWFSLDRKEFFPCADVLAELDAFLNQKPELDYITFSGSGEPTLYGKLGEIIGHIKSKYPQYKTALLTNSTLLTREDVRMELKELDLCVPSLDSATQEGLMKVDRPHEKLNLKIEDIIEGIKRTRDILKGQMWIEIFMVPGVNDTPRELSALKKAIEYIKPDKVQINSLDRPGTELWVNHLSAEEKEAIHTYLNAEALNEKGPDFRKKNKNRYIPHNTLKGLIAASLEKKSLTAEELSRRLGITVKEVHTVLYLLSHKKVVLFDSEKGLYSLNRGAHPDFYLPEK